MARSQLLFLFLFHLLILVFSDQSVPTSVSNENVVRILSLLRSGDEKLNFNGSRDVILALGNTGSGKSTFTQFLAGNNDELIAKEVDEGEYIIIDTHDRIGHSVISKTLIPEKVVNLGTKMVVYDCPGFGDTGRNEANDIAAAYFIKRVLENVKNIKIVLTVSYPSLRKGVNRNDFFQLLEHVSALIKHVEKYVDGVALIATKVDKTYKEINGVPTMVSDNMVIENIAQFLREVKQSIKTMNNLDQVYKSESKQVKNEVLFKSSNKLLDTLLEKNGTEYSRLGIFRRPDGPGPLSESKLLQREKKTIENMLKNRLKYVPVNVTDIGYAVSEKSINVIWDLETEIVKTITSDVARLNQIIVDHFENLERDMLGNDMYSLAELLKEASKAFDRISSINKSAKTDELVMHLQQNLPKSCVSASAFILGDMANLAKFYNFLQKVSNKKVEPMILNWINELQPAINYVHDSKLWHEFLVALPQRLSEYDVQKDTKRFHVPNLGSVSRSLGSISSFTEFFNEISNLDFLKVVNMKELQKINIDNTKVQYFDRVIASTLGVLSAFNYQFSDDGEHHPGLVASGVYIKLSDVIRNSIYQMSHFLQVFATHTVFIDADLAKSIDVSIVAPRWVIVGSRTINLNGSLGPAHADSQAQNGEEIEGKRNGDDGKPGNPGESAGHFFGIGNVFKNIENLTITAIGGKGGSGQIGGNGARGKNGVSHGINNGEYSQMCDPEEKCYTNIVITKEQGAFSWFAAGVITYIKYGSYGGQGGDAGRGGAGGMGGYAGSITALGVGDIKPSFAKKIGRGGEGDYGLHGKCGYGGIGGTHYSIKYYFGHNQPSTYVYTDGKASDGPKGTCLYSSSLSHSNFKNRQEPVPKVLLIPPAFAISRFREVLMTSFKNDVTKQHALEFYQRLQLQDIIQYDGPKLIYQELVTLEGFCNQLDPRVSRLLYDSLLQRILEQFETVENGAQLKDRKLLEFLSLVISSQLVRLENKSEIRQVFKLQAYFDVIKSVDLAKIRQFFASRAGNDIESVENFIEIVNADIIDAIERTTNEIIKLSEKDINNELGNRLSKLKLFENLKMVGDFLTLCRSLAEADLALVNTLNVTSPLPSVQMTMYAVNGDQIVDDLNTFDEAFEKKIDAVRSSISNEKMTLKALDAKYDDIGNKLEKANVILRSRKALTAHQSRDYIAHFDTSEVVQHLREVNKILSNDPNVLVRSAANRFSNDMKLIQFSVRLHETFLLNGVNLSNVVSHMGNIRKHAISDEALEDQAARIDKIAGKVIDTMAPVLRTTKISLMDDSYKPVDLKALRLLVVQALNQVKLHIPKLIDQFEIDNDLQSVIENIEEAIETMVSLYNGVLPAQHDRALFTSFYNHLKARTELKNNMQEYLIDVIAAHSLFYEYELLVDVYKKYISPLNVTTSVTPPVPNIDQNKLPVRSTFGEFEFDYQRSIISNVNILESNLKSLAKTTSIDTITEEFNSANQRGAFFEWKSLKYENTIAKLLRGKRIELKATLSDKNLKFLRFNDIKLSFKLDDSSVQQSLDEDLSNFNVIMTHSGRSYFNLCGHTELINQDAVRFIYKVNETVTEIDDQSAGPMKPLLSPYTTWIFQLKPVNENVTFTSLLPYHKTEISIELEGSATYVNTQNDTVCQSILRNDPETRVPLLTGSNNSSELIVDRGEDASTDSSLDPLSRSSTNYPDPITTELKELN